MGSLLDVIWVVSSVRKCIRGVSYPGKGGKEIIWGVSDLAAGILLFADAIRFCLKRLQIKYKGLIGLEYKRVIEQRKCLY